MITCNSCGTELSAGSLPRWLRGGASYQPPTGAAELAVLCFGGGGTLLGWLLQRRQESRQIRVGRTAAHPPSGPLHHAHVREVEASTNTVVMEDGTRHRLAVGGARVTTAVSEALQRFRAAQEQAAPVPERDRRALERARER